MGSRGNIELLLLGAAVVLLIPVAMASFASPRLRADDDFGVFWVSARLLQTGQNPYDPDAVNAALPSIGHRRVEEAVPIMRYAPYVLPMFLPLAFLPYLLARSIWFVLSLSAVLFGALQIWSLYGGPRARWWLSWLLSLTFLPVLSMLQKGQVGWWVWLGLLGWVYGARQKNEWAMGASLFLILTKPHLVYLTVVALFLWTMRARSWRALAICGASIAVGTGIAIMFNPRILQQYTYAMVAYPTLIWATPTLGSWLRQAFGVERTWLQFLPTFLGLVWLAFRWRRALGRWEEELPLLITVSLITAVYCWSLDWVLLGWPILRMGAHLAKKPFGLKPWGAGITYLCVNGLALFIQQQQQGDFWLVWMPWVILIGDLYLRKEQRSVVG